MSTGQHPDTYVNEAATTGQGIQSIASAVGGFMGPAQKGPTEKAVAVTSFPDFLNKAGGWIPSSYLAYVMDAAYKQNGGGLCYYVRIVHKLLQAAIPAGSVIAALPVGGTANSATVINVTLPSATQALPIGTLISVGGQVAVVKAASTASPNSATLQLITLLNPLPLGIPLAGTTVTDFHPTTFKQSAPSQAFIYDTAISSQPTRLLQSLYDGLFYNGLSGSTKPNPVVTTTLAAAAAAGATSISLTSSNGLSVGQTLKLPNSNPTSEVVLIAGVLNNVVTLASPLQNSYTIGTSISETSYDLIIYSYGKQVEYWKQLSTSSSAPNYDIATLASPNGGSNYCKLIDLFSSNGLNNFPASVTNLALSGGLDGLANPVTGSSIMTDADYTGNALLKTGIYAFDAIKSVVLNIAAPGITTAAVQAAITAYSEARKDTFPVLDSPLAASPAQMNTLATTAPYLVTSRSSIYYPWVDVPDPIGQGYANKKRIPPCGFVIGQYGRTDKTRGVYKAPAGQSTQLIGATGLEYYATDDDHDLLNPVGVNVLRAFSGLGIIIDGARTLSSASGDLQFNVVNVRRLFLQIEKEVQIGTRFAVFEPITQVTFDKLYLYITQYLLDKFKRGWFAGDTPDTSFVVIINGSNNTNQTAQLNQINIAIGLAPSRPGEFIYITVTQVQAGANLAQSTSLGV